MQKLMQITFKNKILFSTLLVILLLSAGVTIALKWVLLPTLTDELKRRGIALAQSIAERSRGFILTEDHPNLETLVFDAAQLEERKLLISYIFILDTQQKVLSDTFIHVFPDDLRKANTIPFEESHSIKLLRVQNDSAYDIAVPIMEGIYQIGAVHVGLSKKHIDQLIHKLGITFFAIISGTIVIGFLVTHWLSRFITRPISKLIKVSDEISRGKIDIIPNLGGDIKCWEIEDCQKQYCPAYNNTDFPCWYVDETECSASPNCRKFPEKLKYCYDCAVYRKHVGDEIAQLADSFNHMTRSLKTSQENLKESEEKYRSLFDNGPNPIFVLDRETLEVLDANPSAERTYNYSKLELMGMAFTDLGEFQYKNTDLANFEKSKFQNTYVVSPKARHRRKNNKPFYVNAHACPTRYKGREAIIVATTDITEMMEKDAQLIQASKMTTLGEMSAGIAHELNQPLNAIKMGNEYLKMMIDKGKKIPDQDFFHVVKEASAQVDRAAGIINRLREFGRKADFTKDRVNINKTIRDVLAIIGRQLSLQNIEVNMDLEENIPYILAHKNRLEQVIFNLVTNARDAINQKKEEGAPGGNHVITIQSFLEDDKVAVIVADTGIGIPKDARHKVFEPFFTTKEVGKGLGLGLSIIYGIVRDYAGEIDVQSQEGVGSTFKMTFPCAAL